MSVGEFVGGEYVGRPGALINCCLFKDMPVDASLGNISISPTKGTITTLICFRLPLSLSGI